MKFKCPKCEKTLKASDSMAGKRGKCPACGQTLVLPGNPSPIPLPPSSPPPVATAGAHNDAATSARKGVQTTGPSDRRRRLEQTLREISGNPNAFDMLMWRLANASMDGETEDAVFEFLDRRIVKGKAPPTQLRPLLKEAIQELRSSPDYLKPEFTNLNKYEKEEPKSDEAAPVSTLGKGRETEMTTEEEQGASWELLEVSQSGSVPAAEKVLAKGADVNFRSKGEGQTPLHRAAMYGREDMVCFLLARGADINAKDNWANTPVHMAANEGSVSTVTTLLKRGAEINAQDQKGMTPLDIAARYVETFPHDPASRAKYAKMAEYLRSHGGREGRAILQDDMTPGAGGGTIDKEKSADLLRRRLVLALTKYKTYADAAKGNADNIQLYYGYNKKRDEVGRGEIMPLGQEIAKLGGATLMQGICLGFDDPYLREVVSIWWDGVGGWQH